MADTVAFEYAKENGTLGLDYNQIYDAVKYGYHQAEKDLELTWKDMLRIDEIISEVYKCSYSCITRDIYQEVLKRFKEKKEI